MSSNEKTTASVMQLQPVGSPQRPNDFLHQKNHRYNMSSNYQQTGVHPKDQKNPTFYPSDRNLSATDSYDHLLVGDDRGGNAKQHR